MGCKKFIFKIIIFYISILNIKYIFSYLKKNNQYFFCKKCINEKNISRECYNCQADILFKSIKFMSKDETIRELLENRKSIARFGDGEFKIIFGKKVHFQNYNHTLKEKLLKVLKSKIPGLLIGIIRLCGNKNKYWINFMDKYKFKLAKIINKNKIYYHAGITRFFHQISNRTQILYYFNCRRRKNKIRNWE